VHCAARARVRDGWRAAGRAAGELAIIDLQQVRTKRRLEGMLRRGLPIEYKGTPDVETGVGFETPPGD